MKQALGLMILGVLLSLRGSHAQESCPAVSGYTVVTGNDAGTLMASWEDDSDLTRIFTVKYSPTSDSDVISMNFTGSPVVLTGLLNFTKYTVSVTPSCDNGGTGDIQTLEADTRATLPSGHPDTFRMKSIPEDGPVFNISWSPILEHQWNGVPLGYYVFLYRSPNRKVAEVYRVPYPDTYLVVLLLAGEYGIEIAAVNRVGVSTDVFTSDPFEVDPFEVGNPTESASFVEYPYFYILIPGVIFLAIILGIIIVIFKTLRDRNKGSISFARGIDSVSPYGKGFGNVMPMRDLSPNSPNASISVPASSAVASPSFIQQHNHMQQHNHHQQLANRPLPLSPDPALIPADDVFVVPVVPMSAVSTHSSTGRKLTHPGPLPMLEEIVEQPGFVPMSRTMTDPSLGSVFSPVSITAPPGVLPLQHMQQHGQQHMQQQQQHMQQQQQHMQQQQQHVQRVHQQRGRSNTLPSPYEVPDQNAPSHDIHSNGAYLNSSVANRGAGGSNIPPPPTHSPPPLTSNGDLAHSFDDRHQNPQHHPQHPSGMASLPRNMAGKRSFSTSAAQGRSIGVKGAPHMKSEGNIHMGEVEYYLPPVDSDEDPSIVSTSSHGAGSESAAGHHQSLDRGRRPPYSYHHKQRQQSRNPGMINGALASSDQLGNFGVGEGPIPPSYQLPPTGSGVSRDRKRESLFSETSTELSDNGDHMQNDDKSKRESLYSESSGESASENHANAAVSGGGDRKMSRNESVFSETSTESSSSKRHSPGWGGAKSDVGVSHRRQRSKSPPERETFSDVGGLSMHPQQSQNGFV